MDHAQAAALIDRYCLAWSEPQPQICLALLNEVLTTNVRYTDPRADIVGVDAPAAHINRVQEARPGARVRRCSGVDLHHGLARFAWHVVLADGSTLPDGIDLVEFDLSGQRLARIVGFFGPLPAV